MLHFEVLSEDRSGGVVIRSLLDKIILNNISKISETDFTIKIRPHRGKGKIPGDVNAKPPELSGGLLDLLPAKLRAYENIYAGSPFAVFMVMDSDSDDPELIRNTLTSFGQQFAPSLPHVAGVSTEEIEAWILGDEEAILRAYPQANISIIQRYKQDSVCGTWEVLARAVLGEKALGLIRVGYPAVGQYKAEWANHIAPFLCPEKNKSPSFIRFYQDVVTCAETMKNMVCE